MSKWKRQTRRITATLAILISLGCPALAAGQNGWDLLRLVTITEVVEDDHWRADKEFPQALLNATDDFVIEGFYVPIVPQAYVTSFLLVEDPADCPFCGWNSYGPSLEVAMKSPMPDLQEFTHIAIQGQLELIEDPETYMAYRLHDAVLLTDR